MTPIPTTTPTLPTKLAAEALGTALLLATVVGSGIMGERLAAGNAAVALLANSIATGAALYVLIHLFGPMSGAHFNPVVTLVDTLAGKMPSRHAPAYVAVQFFAAVIGVVAANVMFELPTTQWSQHARTGAAQWFSEGVATFTLVFVILQGRRVCPDRVPALVALTIVAAYWFTASTSFANPAVTLARAFTDTFSGIRITDVTAFMAAQIAGALLGLGTSCCLNRSDSTGKL